MTLRLRLILVLVSLVAAGLVVSDFITYSALRSSLVNRMDQQLQVASFPVGGTLLRGHEASKNQIGLRRFPIALAGGIANKHPNAPRQYFVNTDGNGRFGGKSLRGVVIPPGTIGEVRNAKGRVVAHVYFSFGTKTRLSLKLPAQLPGSGESSRSDLYFATTTSGSHPLPYEALAKPLVRKLGVFVVGIPMAGVSDTLSQLRDIEFAVFGFVLGGLALMAWWMIRRDLRPLENIAETASAIAQGDLSRRVSLDEHGVEVRRLGTAFNVMVSGIEQAFSEREASEERLRRFLAEASHELRTPLTSIMGYSEIFALGLVKSPEDLTLAMAHIQEDASRMNRLVDDLFVLAQLDQARPFQMEALDLDALIERSVESFRLTKDDQRLHLSFESEAWIVGDADRLRQMIDNLIKNAIVHSPKEASIEINVTKGDHEVVVVVHDNGPGIRPGEEELVFQPFFRSDQSRSRDSGGAGLGLAIVREVAEAHGGMVRVIQGEGATFEVRLPMLTQERQSTAQRRSDDADDAALDQTSPLLGVKRSELPVS